MQFMSRRARMARLLAAVMLVIPSVAYAADQKEEQQNPDRAALPQKQAGGTAAASGNQAPAGAAAHPDASRRQDLSALQQAWIDASDRIMGDKVTKADAVNEDFLNHVIWYSATDWKRPYPGETEILWPDSFVKAAAKKELDGDDDDDDDDQDEKLKRAAAAAEKAGGE